ncbi:MAG: cytochrome c oxidase subunit 3 family protein [Rhodoblastus sp.]|nr:MAG: cytochrome c oxidase subunit 3 family protein [Rhodoblastus sp.]
MSPADAPAPGRGPFAGLPGHPMMWVLIASELLAFGGALIAFSGARVADPRGFAQAQDHLDRLAGLLNVLVLITSGLFAALAVESARAGMIARTRLTLIVSAAIGCLFLAFKAREYGHHVAQGFTLDSGGFFTLYYLITGFHALHVVLGLIILAVVAARPSLVNVETGVAFWHMVDLVWILVFPIVYLVR